MWRSIRIISDLLIPLSAAWVFAATYHPEAPWAFGRPAEHWVMIAMRITAAVCFLGYLVFFAVKLLELAGFIQVKNGGDS